MHILFESRGKKEDAELELQFRRIGSGNANWGNRDLDFTCIEWEPLFVNKKSNSSGLQLADLTARPIGLNVLRPTQSDRAFDILKPKLMQNGLKVFP